MIQEAAVAVCAATGREHTLPSPAPLVGPPRRGVLVDKYTDICHCIIRPIHHPRTGGDPSPTLVHLVIDPHSGVPAYRQVVEQIRFLVASGALAPGDELPSTRLLAERLGVNPMTISKAYGLLEAEGVLRHRPGLPLTVNARSADAMQTEREAQLRALLVSGARGAVQLGISPTRAAGILRDLMSVARSQAARTPPLPSTDD